MAMNTGSARAVGPACTFAQAGFLSAIAGVCRGVRPQERAGGCDEKRCEEAINPNSCINP